MKRILVLFAISIFCAVTVMAQTQTKHQRNGKTIIVYDDGTWQYEIDYGTMKDGRDGQTYKTLTIGNQVWMAENLNIGKRIDGEDEMTDNGIIEKYCYDNKPSNCDIYGGLYQWDEMMQYSTESGIKGICPVGWHIPTDAEWTSLTDYVGSVDAYIFCYRHKDYIAKALAAKTRWNHSDDICVVGNTPSDNNGTGFSGLPGGGRGASGDFGNIGDGGYFWSSTETSATSAWNRNLTYSDANVYRYFITKGYGFSVRCLRD